MGAKSPTIESFAKYTRAANRAQFLFDPEVTNFLQARFADIAFITVEDGRKEKPPIPPEVERQTPEQKEYIARLNNMTNFFKDSNVLVAPYMKHTQKSFSIPYIDA